MARAVVVLLVFFQTLVFLNCTRFLPVFDIRTDEKFFFPEDYLKLVLEYQAHENTQERIIIPEHLDEEGYIINENGQLVPFKIYKKGNHGSRVMCFLHPRNCRGGFHKRLIGDPSNEGLKDLYELKVYKRKYKGDEKGQASDPSYRIADRRADDGVFDSKYATESIGGMPDQHQSFNTKDTEDRIYDLFPSLKSKYLENADNEIQISDKDLEALNDMDEATRLISDLSKGLEQVAEPLPLQAGSRVKAEVEEYPAYELVADYSRQYDGTDRSRDDVNVFPPLHSLDLYTFRRRN